MIFSVRKIVPTPLELYYAELKKQSIADRNANQTKNGTKESQSGGIGDETTLSSVQQVKDYPIKQKPSQAVNTEEMQALRAQFSAYA